ncbi:hypothetical protein JK361_38625 [Streptomyces sp. 5-8]|uniref:Lipase n=1 Tax=Streptomyces musisoli TaxID=2802280 RepID=A0ABS1PDD6_9ACTN|nr:hypothetical protein [Streptomyces musisoli]MBL1110402.1 hypothetical protein [Streptomyces musisoli]
MESKPSKPARRRVVAALGLSVLTPVVGSATARASTAPRTGGAPRGGRMPLTMTLPVPTGRCPVGTTAMHLVDASRRDPWVPGRHRELMVSLWYPARPAPGCSVARQLPPGTAARWGALAAAEFGMPPTGVDWTITRTHSVTGAPAWRQRGGLPVVLYSPGKNVPRGFGTVLAEELASHGYVVAAVDHTYETLAVEFPGGRLVEDLPETEPHDMDGMRRLMGARVADVRFVLDRLEALNTGGQPDARRQPLPAGLWRGLDLSAVGVFGHSLGGATAAQVMHDDRRVAAAADLDGGVGTADDPVGSVVVDGLDHPFLLMNSAIGNSRDAALASLWRHLRGWHRNIQLPSAGHYSYTDLQAQFPQVAAAGMMPASEVTKTVGTVDSARSLHIQRTYLGAFFDLHLRHMPDHGLLDGPSPHYPEAVFID